MHNLSHPVIFTNSETLQNLKIPVTLKTRPNFEIDILSETQKSVAMKIFPESKTVVKTCTNPEFK